MTDSSDTPRSGRRLGTPRPEWGDNVIQADFGARGRRRGVPRGTGTRDSRVTASSGVRGTAPVRSGPQKDAAGQARSWAGRTLTDAVARGADTARRSRGRGYYREGRVLSFDLTPGEVNALVSGSQLEPFEVSLRWRTLSGNQVRYISAECREHPDDLSRLLAGREPRRDVATLLFREDDLLDSRCTCPDRGGICKHRVAVSLAVADQFGSDPLSFLSWRGIDVDRLLGDVADRREDGHRDRRATGRDDPQNDRGGDEEDAGTRYTAEEFWGRPGNVPQWSPLDTEFGLGLGDLGARDAVIRKVSWNTVDQLHVLDELETCYELLTGDGDRVFGSEPWLSGAPDRIADRD
ncbi:hypothetical protein Csp1_10170 [Corynebacterium provencense]|uniref:SWIM-type domain-containing protein n=1 Tax=Corynebacterium provencense TaxID=1737425 RepID=A0A2Z3YWM4_9CORY|nr:SWIM zinc finger family protein [Corynebacterium provencense]AWT25823.1 hypothetical protein Csp1_10170 [Corynebacterium provencense]MCI1256635.1 SWIM zinc finger family protein [Corynebacterium provencense]